MRRNGHCSGGRAISAGGGAVFAPNIVEAIDGWATVSDGRWADGHAVSAVAPGGGPSSYLNVSATLVVSMSGEAAGAASGVAPSHDGYSEGATCCKESPDSPSPHRGGLSQ
jgi:hypothetical protein